MAIPFLRASESRTVRRCRTRQVPHGERPCDDRRIIATRPCAVNPRRETLDERRGQTDRDPRRIPSPTPAFLAPSGGWTRLRRRNARRCRSGRHAGEERAAKQPLARWAGGRQNPAGRHPNEPGRAPKRPPHARRRARPPDSQTRTRFNTPSARPALGEACDFPQRDAHSTPGWAKSTVFRISEASLQQKSASRPPAARPIGRRFAGGRAMEGISRARGTLRKGGAMPREAAAALRGRAGGFAAAASPHPARKPPTRQPRRPSAPSPSIPTRPLRPPRAQARAPWRLWRIPTCRHPARWW